VKLVVVVLLVEVDVVNSQSMRGRVKHHVCWRHVEVILVVVEVVVLESMEAQELHWASLGQRHALVGFPVHWKTKTQRQELLLVV